MTPEYESRGYLLDDYRLFHLSEPQKGETDLHYHEFCKLLLLRSGSGGYRVGGQRYALQAGDGVLIGSRCVHRPEFQPGVPYERIIIYISPEFLRRQSAPGCPLEQIFSGEAGPILRPTEKEQRRLFALAEQLEKELSGEKYGRVVLANGLLLQLLAQVGRSLHSRAALGPGPDAPQTDRVAELLRYIDAHLAEDLTIDSLAEEFYISKYHMMRLFRQETGQSIHGYLSHRRLLHARDLIARGFSATESCFRSGFRSYSSFTRAYAKQFGTTPTGRSTLLDETYE